MQILQANISGVESAIENLFLQGEKNNGFDVLYHNMKHGVVASKELADFFRERSTIEDNNYKLFSKLAKQVSGSNSVQGTFTPVWVSLKAVLEKLAGLHFQMAQKVSELIKDVSKYSDELHKKHKTVYFTNVFFFFLPLLVMFLSSGAANKCFNSPC